MNAYEVLYSDGPAWGHLIGNPRLVICAVNPDEARDLGVKVLKERFPSDRSRITPLNIQLIGLGTYEVRMTHAYLEARSEMVKARLDRAAS